MHKAGVVTLAIIMAMLCSWLAPPTGVSSRAVVRPIAEAVRPVAKVTPRPTPAAKVAPKKATAKATPKKRKKSADGNDFKRIKHKFKPDTKAEGTTGGGGAVVVVDLAGGDDSPDGPCQNAIIHSDSEDCPVPNCWKCKIKSLWIQKGSLVINT